MGQTKINATNHELARLYLSGMTLQQIGDKYGVTRERIRQRLVRAGFIVKDIKSRYKVEERAKEKSIADKVLMETTNRTIRIMSEELTSAKHNLSVIKKSRSKLIAGFKDTLFEIKGMARMGIRDCKMVGTALMAINNLVIVELSELEKYRVIMKGDCDEENYTKGQN